MPEIRDRRPAFWFWMDNALLDEYGPRIGAYGIAVYACLAHYADGKGQAFPSFRTMSNLLRISQATLLRSLRCLEEEGLIVREQRQNAQGDKDSNIYTLLMVGCSATEAPAPLQKHGCSATEARCSATEAEPDLLNKNQLNKKENPLVESAKKPADLTAFETFWQAYPKKVGKKNAQRLWTREQLDSQVEAICTGVQTHLLAGLWKELQFIPHPSTYLHQERWKDEFPAVVVPTNNMSSPLSCPHPKRTFLLGAYHCQKCGQEFSEDEHFTLYPGGDTRHF